MQDLHAGKARVKATAVPKRNLLRAVKILRIVKLCTFLLLVGSLHASAAGYGQKITLAEKNVPLTKVFAEIKKQTGYQFLYISQALEDAKNVTVIVKEANLEDVLRICFKEQPLSYEIKENTVIIKPKKSTSVLNSSEVNPPKDIKGRVVDNEGKPVADATVTVKGTSNSTVTNANGEFEIAGLADGKNVVIVITHVQFDQLTLSVKGGCAGDGEDAGEGGNFG